MRVFLTGATGYIGSAISQELLAYRHHVLGLARSYSAAATLSAGGVEAHRGALEDLESLRAGARAADGVIHTAFENISDTTDFAASIQADLRAVEAMGEALEGSRKPLVVTSGTMMVTPGRAATEDDPGTEGMPRVPSESLTLSLAERGVRASVMRLPPSVHGEGDARGFLPSLIRIARAKGRSAFVGDGSNRWPAVHRRDAAALYRLSVEAAPAGSRLHAVAEEGVPFRDIAQAVGRSLDLPVTSIPVEEADAHFGFLSRFVGSDNPTSSAMTRDTLGWRPIYRPLIADIDHGHYFAA